MAARCSRSFAVPKKAWRKKKDHGKANAPGLTAAEASDKDRKERERLTRIAGKARATSEDVAEEEDDGIYTRDSPTPRAGESQGGTTITVAPKAAMRPPPPPEPEWIGGANSSASSGLGEFACGVTSHTNR